MFVIGNAIQAVAVVLENVLRLYSLVVVIAVLISWVSPDPFNPVVQFLRSATEPVFDWIRRHLPFTRVGMVDLSPLVALLGIQLLQMVVIRSLIEFGLRLR